MEVGSQLHVLAALSPVLIRWKAGCIAGLGAVQKGELSNCHRGRKAAGAHYRGGEGADYVACFCLSRSYVEINLSDQTQVTPQL